MVLRCPLIIRLFMIVEATAPKEGARRRRSGAAVKASLLAADVQVVIAPTPGTVYVPHSIDARIGREQKPVPPAETNEEAR